MLIIALFWHSGVSKLTKFNQFLKVIIDITLVHNFFYFKRCSTFLVLLLSADFKCVLCFLSVTSRNKVNCYLNCYVKELISLLNVCNYFFWCPTAVNTLFSYHSLATCTSARASGFTTEKTSMWLKWILLFYFTSMWHAACKLFLARNCS